MATQQVGSLIINLEARTAQIQQDMAQTKRIVGDALGDIRKEAGRTAEAMEGIAAVGRLGGIGAAAFLVAGSLDRLKDAAIEVARQLNQAQIASEKLQKTLFYANGGNIRAIGADVDWLRQTANELGQEFGVVSTTYARFAGAVKGSGLEAHAREIFESLALAGSAFGLSVEESEGAMRALVQMSAKGVVSAEEFRGQLADHLPVASQAAARAMGVTTGEFNRMLESGEVIADDFLPKLARELRSMSQDAAKFGGEAQKATAQFNNAWEDMKKEVAASGLGAFISGQLSIMADAFNDFSASVRQARAEGDGFWGQAAAGGGAVLRFVNPRNMFNYRAQSDAGRSEQLKAAIADKKKNLYEFSFSETLPSKQASIKAMEAELAGIEKRMATVGRDVAAGQKQAAAAEAQRKAAVGRADNYVKNGKNQTDKQKFDKDLRDEEAAFRGAVAGLQQNSKEYLTALAAFQERKADIIDAYNKKTAPKKAGRAAQYGSQEDRELAALRAQIASQRQVSGELADKGADAEKLTPGQKLMNKLTEEFAVAKTKQAKAHISAKQALAQELVALELANRATQDGIKAGEASFAASVAIEEQIQGLQRQRGEYGQTAEQIADVTARTWELSLAEAERNGAAAESTVWLRQQADAYRRLSDAQMAVAAVALQQRYETPLQREQRESAANLAQIDGNTQLGAAEQVRLRGLEQARSTRAVGDMQQGLRSELGLVTDEESIVRAHQDMQRRITEVTAAGSAERLALEQASNAKLQQDQMQLAATRLQQTASLFGSLAEITSAFGGKQSRLSRALFAANKAASIANAIINIQAGIASAAKLGFPAGIPAMASVAAATAGIVSTIRGTSLQGMAHDGIDSIPREGTWLLDKGERVVDSRTNADLKTYLQQANRGSGAPVKVVIINNVGAQVTQQERVGADGGREIVVLMERVADSVYSRRQAADMRQGGVLYGG